MNPNISNNKSGQISYKYILNQCKQNSNNNYERKLLKNKRRYSKCKVRSSLKTANSFFTTKECYSKKLSNIVILIYDNFNP